MPPTTAPSLPPAEQNPPGAPLHRAVAEQSPVALLHLDADGIVTFENRRARALLGDDERLGQRFEDVAGFEALAEPLRRLLRDGVPFEASDIRGAHARLRVAGAPIEDAESNRAGGVLVLLDDSAEHAREEALRLQARYDDAEPALRNAALASPDGLALLERAVALFGRTAGADRARALLTGGGDTLVAVTLWTSRATDLPEPIELDPAAWPGLRAGRPLRLAPGDSAAADALLRAAACTHAILVPFRDEGERIGAFLLERHDAERAWTRADAQALGRLGGLFETLWAWAGAEARYHQTVADLEDGLFSFAYDLDGRRRYAFVTPRFETLTGCAAEALVDLDAPAVEWPDLVHEDDRDAFEAHEASLRAGDPSRLVYRLRRPDDGAVRWLRESATPGRSPSGRPVVGGLVSDVTEQQQVSAALREAKRAAERASEAKTAFLATMSHELRSPLGAIRGFAEMLREEVREAASAGLDLPPTVEEFAGIIAENTERALHLVHHLFDLSRLETGALNLRREPVRLHPAVGHVVLRHREAAEAKGLALRFDPADGDPVVLGDPDRVGEVVAHLVSNAVKFTESGGITVATSAEGGAVRLVVEDTGVGIAEAYLDHLFEPFSQEDYRLNRTYGGSGLGLAITKRLLDGMGGTIHVESEKGRGSRFDVTFEAVDA
ncbi:MAG: ATP-binding protein [Rubricoccaceae bacterium]|nr:ATP-binding protein [Rubricoccaceae bacterium]